MDSEDRPFLNHFCHDDWTWNHLDRSEEVHLYGDNMKIAKFHPTWSKGTAGVRGTRILNTNRYYWEIHVAHRVFGTSMMIGIGTRRANIHRNNFVNMIGEDEQGWGLSHEGLLWHNGNCRLYTIPFHEYELNTIGVLFDGINGTLTYYYNGRNLSIAFTDLHLVQDELYPIVCSTAANTEMSLGVTKREFCNLQEKCRSTILRLLTEASHVDKLHLPGSLKHYLLPERNVNHEGQNIIELDSNFNTNNIPSR